MLRTLATLTGIRILRPLLRKCLHAHTGLPPDVRPSVHAGMAICPAARRAFIVNPYTTRCATLYISCELLRASHSRNPHRYSHSRAVLTHIASCSYRFASECAYVCACKHAHPSARPESLYSKQPYCTQCYNVYKLRAASLPLAASASLPVFALPRCAHAHRFLLIPVCLRMCVCLCV